MQERPEPPETPVKTLRPENRDLRGRRDLLDSPDNPVPLASRARPLSRRPRSLARPDLPETLARPDPLDLLEPPDRTLALALLARRDPLAPPAYPPGNDGNPGAPGQPGQAGAAGEKGICPKYCAIDGGVFFEDGTRR
ncbi:hypothetical protein M3Y99_01486400 [Aphelenchoides fujianensis]|nr:hypothetical protein M3Y99_01486400 [Aphelenchoides fujianensis]